MGITRFFSEAIGSAVTLGLATHDDVLRHATPDVLAKHLPRPLWSKLITACLAAPKTDARLVVETITVPVLCEHVPPMILWACVEMIGRRVLDKAVSSAASAAAGSAGKANGTNGAAAGHGQKEPAAAAVAAVGPGAASGATSSPAVAPAATASASVAAPPPSLPAPPAVSPKTTSTLPTVATPANVPAPIATTPATASQPVVTPRAQTNPVVPATAATPPYGTSITQSRVATVGGAGASTRRAGTPTAARPGGPPSPPPKSARLETEPPVVDVDDAQVIDFGGPEETFVGRDDAPKR